MEQNPDATKQPSKKSVGCVGVIAILFVTVFLISLFSTLTNKAPSTSGQTNIAKPQSDTIDAPLNNCLLEKAQGASLQKDKLSYNDFGVSAKGLLNRCSSEIKIWCQSNIDAYCTTGNCDFICDMNKNGTDGIGVLFLQHVYELANDAIKKAAPQNPQKTIENVFRDCVEQVVIDGGYAASACNFSSAFACQDYFSNLNAKCNAEIQVKNNECYSKKKTLPGGNDSAAANDCLQATGYDAVNILNEYRAANSK